jgi:hypothetical protein
MGLMARKVAQQLGWEGEGVEMVLVGQRKGVQMGSMGSI